MKQSKKLLSLVLAVVMAISCFGVAVSAKYPTAATEVKYDHTDKGFLNSDQLSSLVIDLIDDALGDIDLDSTLEWALGIIGLKIGSFDEICQSLQEGEVSTALNAIGGDVANLDRSAVKNTKRSNGDTKCIADLVAFIASNFGAGAHLEKVAYGIDKNGNNGKLGAGTLWDDSLKILFWDVELGFSVQEALGEMEIASGVSLLDLLNDIPGKLKPILYDVLLYGSYQYTTTDAEGHEHAKNIEYADSGVASLTYDEIVSKALVGLLTDPQDFEYVGEGDAAYKVWDEAGSVISNQFAALTSAEQLEKVNITSQSLLDILDGLLPIVWSEYGVHGINVSLKKAVMDAVGMDFTEIPYSKLPANAKAAFGPEGEKFVSSYCHYGIEDNIIKGTDGMWYFTKIKRKAVGVDENGEEITSRVRVYYSIDPNSGNEIAPLINLDYEFKESDLDTKALVTNYGSIFGSLNHLIYLIFDKAIFPAELNYGSEKYTKVSDFWTDGGSEKLQANLDKTVRIVLKRYTKDLFGKDHEYVDAKTGMATAEFANIVNTGDLVDLIEYIGLPFFKETMPQLIYPTPKAGAKYVFDDGVQILEFGAIVIRELLSDAAPYVNYDNLIYSGDITSAEGRKMADHSVEEWENIILTMGADIACGTLYNTLDFTDTKTAGATRTVTANYDWSKVITAKSDADVLNGSAWRAEINNIVEWGLDYIGSGSTGALFGLEPDTIKNAYDDPLDRLSAALNKILPLGFISGCTSEKFDFDISLLFDKLFDLAENFNLAGILELIGRNNASEVNILTQKNVSKVLLDTVNRIFKLIIGRDLIPTSTSLNGLITKDNVKQILLNLIGGLNARVTPVVTYLFPVVGNFVEDWTGDDSMSDVEIKSISGTTATVEIDRPDGLWLSYTDASNARKYDSRYQYKVTGAKVTDLNGNTGTAGVTASVSATTLNESNQSVNVTISGTASKATVLKLVVTYDVIAPNGVTVGTGFTTEKAFISGPQPTTDHDSDNDTIRLVNKNKSDDVRFHGYSPYYANIDDPAACAEALNAFKVYKVRTDRSRSDDKNRCVYSVTVTPKTETYGITIPGVTNDKSYNGGALSTSAGDSSNTYYTNATAENIANIKTGTVITYNLKVTAGTNTSITSAVDNIDVSIKFYSANQRKDLCSLITKSAELNRANYTQEDWDAFVAVLNAAAASANVLPENLNSSVNLDYASTRATVEAAREALDAARLEEPRDIGASSNASAADFTALQNALDAAEAVRADRGYVDFYTYRWSRYRSARNEANSILGTLNASKVVAETKEWTYNDSIKGSEIAGYASQVAAANAYYKTDYINALLKDMSAEDIAAYAQAKQNSVDKVQSYSALKVKNAANEITVEAARLKVTATAPNDGYYFLNADVNSAKNVIGTTNTGYTGKSWSAYAAALAAAQEALTSGSNATMFDARYELNKARNNLKVAAEEADYGELEGLIAQAEAVLANAGSYKNATIDFAKLLAALGVAPVEDAKGNEVQLFPSSAKVVAAKSYAKDDQDKVDRAADELRYALAKMEFNGTTVAGAKEINVGTDEDPKAISVVTIDAKQTADAAKAAFSVANATSATVSGNGIYALAADAEGFVGTGSSITFYKNVSGVNVPVATVTVVVKSDVTGDGVLDVLDSSLAELVVNKQAKLSGAFFEAAKRDGADEETVIAADYTALVNNVLGA